MAPQNPDGYIKMGNLRMAQKKYDEAEKYFGQALKLAPSSADALTGLLDIAVARNEPAKALRMVQEPVSYTHLDVYKRQVLKKRCPSLVIMVWPGISPPSPGAPPGTEIPGNPPDPKAVSGV